MLGAPPQPTSVHPSSTPPSSSASCGLARDHSTIMLSSMVRVRAPVLFVRPFFRTYSASVNQVPANDPAPKEPKQNVSATNAAPTSSEGSFDKVLQESVETGEELRVMQAPNRQAPNNKGIWSRSQQPRAVAMTGPRFEQTIMEDQVHSLRFCKHTRSCNWRNWTKIRT